MKGALIQGGMSVQNINKSPMETYLDYEDITIAPLCTMAYFKDAQSEQSACADYYDGWEQTSFCHPSLLTLVDVFYSYTHILQ